MLLPMEHVYHIPPNSLLNLHNCVVHEHLVLSVSQVVLTYGSVIELIEGYLLHSALQLV